MNAVGSELVGPCWGVGARGHQAGRAGRPPNSGWKGIRLAGKAGLSLGQGCDSSTEWEEASNRARFGKAVWAGRGLKSRACGRHSRAPQRRRRECGRVQGRSDGRPRRGQRSRQTPRKPDKEPGGAHADQLAETTQQRPGGQGPGRREAGARAARGRIKSRAAARCAPACAALHYEPGKGCGQRPCRAVVTLCFRSGRRRKRCTAARCRAAAPPATAARQAGGGRRAGGCELAGAQGRPRVRRGAGSGARWQGRACAAHS